MVGVFFMEEEQCKNYDLYLFKVFFFYNPTLLHKDKAISGSTAEKREPL